MLEHIVSPHPVKDKLRLIGHADDVILHGMGKEAALVDQLDECEPSVLLQ
jgi:hypothetical protein